MKFNNNNGIALITALMFTFLALVISMSLLYMVTSSIQVSGAYKRYKTALDASYGGTEIITKDILASALSFQNQSSSFASFMSSKMGDLGASTSFSNCFQSKLENPRRFWGSCAVTDANPKTSPDITFPLSATAGSPYTVYSKIVDTTEWRFTSFSSAASGRPVAITKVIAGNSDRGGNNDLMQGGVVVNKSPTVPHYPYIYKMEIQGEKQQNPAEKANLSVMYAY